MGGYSDPTKWHDQFFSFMSNCKVDYIAFILMMVLRVYMSELGLLKKYNRPVWVKTEFTNK